eukprot:scaffold16922_cov51-Phaeocystis_antarctica.AAC.4
MVTVGGKEIDVAEIKPGSSGSDLLMRALTSSTVRSIMFCWMVAVEDGLAVVATSRMVSASPVAWRRARVPTGETVKLTETVAPKGGGGGEGGGQGGEGGEGGDGGCVGGEGGDDGDGGRQFPKAQLEP